jgi:hypothetical protein
MMRKPIDFDSELKALADKTRALKERRVRQLGELVTGTGADQLDTNVLAGALLSAASTKDSAAKEEWRKAGESFFRGSGASRRRPRTKPQGASSGDGQAQPDDAGSGAA